MATNVIFRAGKRGEFKDVVTAVFPDQGDRFENFVCYAHVGQHSTCSLAWYRATRPASAVEDLALVHELEQIYGPLKIKKRLF